MEIPKKLRRAGPLRGLTVDQIIVAIERGQARLYGDVVVPVTRGGANTPAFAATPHNASAIASGTLDTSLTAPTNVATLFTAGASGSKVEELVFEGLGTTAAGVINVFLYDGSTYHLYDQYVVTAITSSATAAAYRANRTYENLILQSGWSIRFTVTVAGLQSLIKGSAFGGDY